MLTGLGAILVERNSPVIVIGGGIIGLSIFYELSARGIWNILIESRERFGEGASSRNSEVIHGGFLSAPDSLRQKMCLSGGKELTKRVEEWGISSRRCGKLVVATAIGEVPRLDQIVSESERIGVECQYVGPEDTAILEPAMATDFSKAAWFPNSGVFDTHSYMKMLANMGEENGSDLLFQSKAESILCKDGLPYVIIGGEEIEADLVINTSGMDSDRVLESSGVSLAENGLEQEAWTGQWYRIKPGSTKGMERLVYRTSTPDQPGLGVHTTPDWEGGGVRLGPDSIKLEGELSDFDSRHIFDTSGERKKAFYDRLSILYPELSMADLIPDQSGIRSRSYNEQGVADFRFIIGEGVDLPRTMHLLGMESPGVTASPAIAWRVADWVEGQ